MTKQLLHINEKLPERRLAMIFVGGKKARIRGVRLDLVDAENEDISLSTDTFSAGATARAERAAEQQQTSLGPAPVFEDDDPFDFDEEEEENASPNVVNRTPDTVYSAPDTGLLTPNTPIGGTGRNRSQSRSAGQRPPTNPQAPRQRPPDVTRPIGGDIEDPSDDDLFN